MKRASHYVDKHHQGFSLLELMVVMVLIGITATLIVLTIDNNSDRLARYEAERFAAILRQVQEEAIIAGSSLAIELDVEQKRFSFLRYDEKWMEIQDDEFFRPRSIPQVVKVTLMSEYTGGSEDDQLGHGNEIILIDALGQVSSFGLQFNGESTTYLVHGPKLDASIAVEPSETAVAEPRGE